MQLSKKKRFTKKFDSRSINGYAGVTNCDRVTELRTGDVLRCDNPEFYNR